MEILVDSNVILDIVTEDKKWFTWSSRAWTIMPKITSW